MVHRLVYESFKGEIPKDMEINHIDYDRLNNNIENLEVLSHADNVRYSHAVKVKQYSLDGKFINIFDSLSDIERILGIDHRQISACINGIQKTCHGYKWEKVI